jgi:hypothetical protein
MHNRIKNSQPIICISLNQDNSVWRNVKVNQNCGGDLSHLFPKCLLYRNWADLNAPPNSTLSLRLRQHGTAVTHDTLSSNEIGFIASQKHNHVCNVLR